MDNGQRTIDNFNRACCVCNTHGLFLAKFRFGELFKVRDAPLLAPSLRGLSAKLTGGVSFLQ